MFPAIRIHAGSTCAFFASISLIGLLAGCGGGGSGGGGGSTAAAPTAHATADQTVPVGALVTVDGSASNSPSGTPLSYQWALTQKPAGSIASLSNATSARASFTPDVPGVYNATLVVTANGVASQPDTVGMTAVAGNVAPVANAGPDRSAPPGGSVTLDGTASHDPNNTSVTYSWRIVKQPPGSNPVLTNANTATPTLTADLPGIYTLELIVSDGTLSSPPVQTQCTVATGNLPPVANAGPDQTVTVGQLVTLSGVGSSDPNGDPLTYSWCVQGRPEGSSVSLTGANTVQPTFTPDAPGSYVLCLTVADGKGGSGTDIVIVEARSSFPQTNGRVFHIVPDGAGGIYVSGDFTQLRTTNAQHLAHILSNGQVDSSWNPQPSGSVGAMIVTDQQVYIAGAFSMVGGQERWLLAAVDRITGAPTPWNPNVSGGDAGLVGVFAMAKQGSIIYVGGDFDRFGGNRQPNGVVVGGVIRHRLAALDAVTGSPTPWDPNADANTVPNPVGTLTLSGSTVYAGGNSGAARAFDANTAAATPWNPQPRDTLLGDAQVTTLLASGNLIYVGGGFNEIMGQPRRNFAAVDNVTAVPTDLVLNPDGAVTALFDAGPTLYIAFAFNTIAGQPRGHVAAVDKTTGAVMPWNPNPDNLVRAILVQNGKVYLGGDFTTVGGQTRNFLAVVDAVTGEVIGE